MNITVFFVTSIGDYAARVRKSLALKILVSAAD